MRLGWPTSPAAGACIDPSDPCDSLKLDCRGRKSGRVARRGREAGGRGPTESSLQEYMDGGGAGGIGDGLLICFMSLGNADDDKRAFRPPTLVRFFGLTGTETEPLGWNEVDRLIWSFNTSSARTNVSPNWENARVFDLPPSNDLLSSNKPPGPWSRMVRSDFVEKEAWVAPCPCLPGTQRQGGELPPCLFLGDSVVECGLSLGKDCPLPMFATLKSSGCPRLTASQCPLFSHGGMLMIDDDFVGFPGF